MLFYRKTRVSLKYFVNDCRYYTVYLCCVCIWYMYSMYSMYTIVSICPSVHPYICALCVYNVYILFMYLDITLYIVFVLYIYIHLSVRSSICPSNQTSARPSMHVRFESMFFFFFYSIYFMLTNKNILQNLYYATYNFYK